MNHAKVRERGFGVSQTTLHKSLREVFKTSPISSPWPLVGWVFGGTHCAPPRQMDRSKEIFWGVVETRNRAHDFSNQDCATEKSILYIKSPSDFFITAYLHAQKCMKWNHSLWWINCQRKQKNLQGEMWTMSETSYLTSLNCDQYNSLPAFQSRYKGASSGWVTCRLEFNPFFSFPFT